MKISDLPPGSAVLVPAEWLAERVGEETPNGGDRRQRIIDIAVREGTKNIRTPGPVVWAASENGATPPDGGG